MENKLKIDWIIVITLVLMVFGAFCMTFGIGTDKHMTIFGFGVFIMSIVILLFDYLIQKLWKK